MQLIYDLIVKKMEIDSFFVVGETYCRPTCHHLQQISVKQTNKQIGWHAKRKEIQKRTCMSVRMASGGI